MIAAAYIRVSTEEQAEFSPDSQRKRILEYAKYHNIQIPEEYIFVDEGVSGRTASRRPAFQQMIALARTRSFQQILVWKFSRFARSRQDSIFYKSMLRKDCGVEVISITEPLTQDPTSILIEALLEAMDEYYSINLAQEVKRGMEERFIRGRAVSIPPFGYRMGTDTFEPHPEQSAWVPVIFQSYTKGESPSCIAADLNRAGVLTSRGNSFQARAIAYILRNPVYIGKLRKRKDSPSAFPRIYDRYYEIPDMEYVEGSHPPLIDLSLWIQAQERWQATASNRSASRYTPPDSQPCPSAHLPSGRTAGSPGGVYFLQGLVTCSHCGRHLVRIHRGSGFQCSGYNHGICKESHYVTQKLLEHLVLEAAAALLPPHALACLYRPDIPDSEKNDILQAFSPGFIYCKSRKQILLGNGHPSP